MLHSRCICAVNVQCPIHVSRYLWMMSTRHAELPEEIASVESGHRLAPNTPEYVHVGVLNRSRSIPSKMKHIKNKNNVLRLLTNDKKKI